MKTWPFEIPCFEIANTHELGWWGTVIRDVQAATSDTTICTWFCCTGVSSIGGIQDAEVFGNTTVTPKDAQMQSAMHSRELLE